jgi:hypothetical protein
MVSSREMDPAKLVPVQTTETTSDTVEEPEQTDQPEQLEPTPSEPNVIYTQFGTRIIMVDTETS